ncbi:hypothetical protein K503DRAFT_819222 [Rhizopogon vinicolor AM-OR11-026]|uniref:Winged helix-turn helix domain-containing protein n=1 Tax=Rhizopogon vinicolor AM-OR11-026 TaxID=1314800 RepID=A0A1B7MDK9_9AGAM|nr:hypothetical protein K503DRAFT_819222 [Rhizopogon vinicolor AM-OR11-026]
MPFRKISRDVKLVAIQLPQHDLLPLPDILQRCGFSERTWFRILKQWWETGNVNRQPSRVLRGHLRTLDHEDIDCLLHLVRQNHCFLDKFMHMLKTNRFISVHFTTIFRKLERIGLSYIKLKWITKECNKTLHAEFIARMGQYDPSELGFIDETSKDCCCDIRQFHGRRPLLHNLIHLIPSEYHPRHWYRGHCHDRAGFCVSY